MCGSFTVVDCATYGHCQRFVELYPKARASSADVMLLAILNVLFLLLRIRKLGSKAARNK